MNASSTLSRRQLLIGSAALASASLIICCLVGEVAARMLFSPRRAVVAYRFDPRYGFVHRPGEDTRTYAWGDGKPWRYRINSRGFRGDEWTDSARSGKHRLIMMGDSFTFGVGLEESEAVPAVVQQKLGTTAFEVINAGVSGWGPQNALAWLETEGSSLSGNCLVYAFFEGNDVVDGTVANLYQLSNGQLARSPLHDRSDQVARIDESMRALPGYAFLLRHSQLFNVARSAVFSRIAVRDAANASQRLYANIDSAGFGKALTLNTATLQKLSEIGEARFGGFGMILIPMLGQVSPRAAPNNPFPSANADAAHASVVEWAQRHGIPLVDVHERLLGIDSSRASALYFKNDFHLSAAGAQLVGNLIAENRAALCASRAKKPGTSSGDSASPPSSY